MGRPSVESVDGVDQRVVSAALAAERGMSAGWAPLLPLAMVGTERHSSPLPTWPGEVGQLVAVVVASGEGTAAGVLRAAAVLAICELAGSGTTPWTEALPSGAADEALPP